MKQFFRTIGCCLSLVGAVSALEVSELPVQGLTREYADSNFSKDYDYYILSDYSVRRIWKSEGYTLMLDFDIRSSKLLALYIDYEPAARKKDAMEHMRHLCEGRDEDTKWVKTKEKSANKIGLKNARHRSLTDGSLLFWESAGSSGDCERMCWFVESPREDRLKIAEANKNTGKTAMGSSSGGGFEVLFKDEDRRRSSSATPRPTTVPSAPSNVQPEPEPEQGAEPATEQPARARGEQVAVTNPLAKWGIELNDETKKWLMYGGGALLLIIIWNRIAAARRRARQTAAFEALLHRGEKDKDK